jgi:hypothetical protein
MQRNGVIHIEWKRKGSLGGLDDVSCLHVERNQVMGASYLEIEDTFVLYPSLPLGNWSFQAMILSDAKSLP